MYSIENRGEMIWQDEDGETDRHSHFSTAGIDKEKRYLLRIRQDDCWHFIPAVKKDDKYLNLVSMEEMTINYENTLTRYIVSGIYFILKSYFEI